MALNGTNGADSFRGTVFDDEVFGFGGNDFISGSPGQDTINGGSSVDTVDYSRFIHLIGLTSPVSFRYVFGDAVNVDLQRAVQSGGFADGDSLIGIENVTGSFSNDVIRGDGEANVLTGLDGNDTLAGRDGNDTLFGDGLDFDGIPTVGNDVLDGGAGDDQLFGGPGTDLLIGGSGVNELDGGDGVDTASYAGSARGMLVALTGANGSGVALSPGISGGDTLAGIENVIGSDFADSIFGSQAANVLDGGAGDDIISGGAGADTLRGGAGIDTASYAGSSAGVDVVLGEVILITTPFGNTFPLVIGASASGGDAQGDSLSGIENLTGSRSGDNLTGNSDANRLDGRAGDDNIFAEDGDDVVIGGAQNDIDRLSGGAGFDTFLYLDRNDSRSAVRATGDFIQDFDVARDTIDLRALTVDPASLLIQDRVIDGANFSTVTEDANGNSAIDVGEFNINVRMEGAGFVTLQDILV